MESTDTELEYKKALIAAREHIKRLQDEKRTLQEVHEEFKQHYERLNKDFADRGKKLMELITEKKASDETYETSIRHYRALLAQRDKALQELQARSFAPGDADVLRTKIAREVEAQYKQKTDALVQENERLENEVLELKRNLALTKTELEGANKSHEKQIAALRQKHMSQINDMTEELKVLQKTGDSGPDKERIRALKRDLGEAQRRADDLERELTEIKRERDQLRLEKDSAHFEKSKIMGQEELVKITYAYELERMSVKLKGVEEDLLNEVNKGNEKQHKVEQLTFELDSVKKRLTETELDLNSYKRKAAELQEILKDREAEINTYVKRTRQDEKENYLLDREEKAKLQAEIDRLESTLMQVTEQSKVEKDELYKRMQGLESDKKSGQEDIKGLRKKVTELQASNEALKENYLKAMDKSDALEKELRKLQEKHRNLLSTEQAHVTAKDKLELALRNLEEDHQKLNEEKVAWGKERKDLQTQLVDLTQRIEKITKDAAEKIQLYRRKAKDYKIKVRQANLKLSQMASKLARVQAENDPLPGNVATMGGRIGGQGSEFAGVAPELREMGNEIAKTLDRHKQIAGKMGL